MTSRPPLPCSPRAAHAFPPSTIPSTARTTPPVAAPSPFRPKRPQSASRVQTTTTGNAATLRPRSSTPPSMAPSPHRRPASASRVRANDPTSTWRGPHAFVDDVDDDVDTMSFPVPRVHVPIPTAGERQSRLAEPSSTVQPLQQRDDHPPSDLHVLDRGAIAKAEQFLTAWQREEASFRSPLLYAESSFVQAKAMTAATTEWPQPNVFLSSIAFGALELVCQSLERQHPFLMELLDTVGAALFTNYEQLWKSVAPAPWKNRFLHYMHHGDYCFQQLHVHDEQLRMLRSTAQQAKAEVTRLTEKLQKQHVARLFERVQTRVKTAAATTTGSSAPAAQPSDETAYPQLRRVLYTEQRGAHLDLHANDYEFEPSCNEIVLFFNSLPPQEAHKLLRALHTTAAEVQVPQLGESYAIAVDLLSEKERRLFLTEYFQLVSTDELQDALRDRDESNQDKQWQTFLDEMKGVLCVDDTKPVKHPGQPESFHSDEARIGTSVYELVDLVGEMAAEVSLAEEKKPLRVSPELTARLKPYLTVKKKMEKARQLMMAKPAACMEPVDLLPRTCACVCGNHKLVYMQEGEESTASPVATVDTSATAQEHKRPSKRRKSSAARATSKRKSTTHNGSSRVNTRASLATVRLFPLAEACHLVSLVVQLQFSRDAAVISGAATPRRGSTRRESQAQAQAQAVGEQTASPRLSFKALTKDLLMRKYGIKSIAIMHMLQLEKSLVHYGATDKHPRCELFAWFIGADKMRCQYKDLGYVFYLRVVKTVIGVLLKKPVDALTYAELIAAWTEQIGEAETTVSGSAASSLKTLSASQCMEVCNVAFPVWMKATTTYEVAVERFKSAAAFIDIEQLIKRVMAVWEAQVVLMLAQLEEVMTTTATAMAGATSTATTFELDVSSFSNCMAACGVEMTSAQALEHFDWLTPNDGITLPISKAVLFAMEQKYLRYL